VENRGFDCVSDIWGHFNSQGGVAGMERRKAFLLIKLTACRFGWIQIPRGGI